MTMTLSSAAFAFGLFLLVSSGWASATEKHSGAVVAADATQVTIEEMGPWHGPSTLPMRRTYKWDGGTRVMVAERSQEGVNGWPWAFSDQAAQPSSLHIGDFVTVTTERRAIGGVAIEMLVVWPGTHLEVPGSS